MSRAGSARGAAGWVALLVVAVGLLALARLERSRGLLAVAVEDTSTTGGSVLTACEALAEAGADIAAVAVIVHRADASRDAVEQAGHRYLSAYDISELEI